MRRFKIALVVLTGVLIAALIGPQTASAANATWNGTIDAAWVTDTNWSATPVPGAGNTATFNNAGNSNVVIDLGFSGVTISSRWCLPSVGFSDFSSLIEGIAGEGSRQAVGSRTFFRTLHPETEEPKFLESLRKSPGPGPGRTTSDQFMRRLSRHLA